MPIPKISTVSITDYFIAAPALGTLGTVSILGVGQKILAIAK
jgi:hypothetical protein